MDAPLIKGHALLDEGFPSFAHHEDGYVEHGAPRQPDLRLWFFEQEKAALAGGDAGAVGGADDFALGQAPAAGLGVEHAPHQDWFIGFEGGMVAHFQSQGEAGAGKMPHRVGHHLIQQGGQDAAMDDAGPALELPRQRNLGFGRQLGFPVGNGDLQPPGIVLAADKAVIIGDGNSHSIPR